MSPKKWELKSQRIVYENPFVGIFEDTLLRPDGKLVENYYSVRRRDAAFIIAVTQEQEIPLVYQYKNGVKDLIWELPAGFIEEVEEPEKAAARELLEETGFQGEKLELLGKYAPNPSISNNRNFVFLAKNAKKVAEQKLDSNEDIEVRLFPLKEVVESIREQKSQFVDLQSQLSLLLLGLKLGLWKN